MLPLTMSRANSALKTLFPQKPDGARVNIEVDVLAKYVARLLGKPGVDGVEPGRTLSGVSEELLARMGYLDRERGNR